MNCRFLWYVVVSPPQAHDHANESNSYHTKISHWPMKKLIVWLVVFCLMSCSKILHSYGEVKIQNLALRSSLYMAYEQEGSLWWHTYCDTEYWFSRTRVKNYPIFCRLVWHARGFTGDLTQILHWNWWQRSNFEVWSPESVKNEPRVVWDLIIIWYGRIWRWLSSGMIGVMGCSWRSAEHSNVSTVITAWSLIHDQLDL